jgi:type II secretion system protein G
MNRSLPLAEGQAQAPVVRHSHRGAFTLIELLVVVAIIAILAALGLSTLGYVQKKGARARAEAEVAALSAAIESYKTDHGFYPASNNLYAELTAQAGSGIRNTNKVYFEVRSNMVSGGSFTDPWNNAYGYEPSNPAINIGFFDLWSTANADQNSNNWIRN